MVLGVDPGVTTGLAVVDGSGRVRKAMQVTVGDFDDAAVESLVDVLRAQSRGVEVVVCEDWRLYPAKGLALGGDSLVAAQIVGIVRALGALNMLGGVESRARVVLQPPTIKQASWLDRWLSRQGTDLRRHEKDAARHALYWLVVRSGSSTPVSELARWAQEQEAREVAAP